MRWLLSRSIGVALCTMAFASAAAAGVAIDLAATYGDWAVWGGVDRDNLAVDVHIADLNGDGVPDLVTDEADGWLSSGLTGSRVCIWFGPLALPSQHDLLSETPPSCIELPGAGTGSAWDQLETGDLDGDGIADLVQFSNNSSQGGLVRVYRGRAAWPALLSETDADWTFQGAFPTVKPPGTLQAPVIGDLNGDGNLDLAMFDPPAPASGARGGRADGYIFFGRKGGWTKKFFDLAVDPADVHLSMTGGFGGIHQQVIANAIGDAIPDLVVATFGGQVLVLRGRTTWPASIDLDVPGAADLVITGFPPDNSLGSPAVGDVDGDGVPDLVLAAPALAPAAVPTRTAAGEIFVLRGPLAPGTRDLSMKPADATVYGPRVGSYLGTTLRVGDVTGDGFDDIVASAPVDPTPYARTSAGAVYVIAGCSGLPAFQDLAVDPAAMSIYGRAGLDPTRPNGDHFGQCSLFVADVNGDGRADVLAGSWASQSLDPARGDYVGEAHLVLGQAETGCGVTASAGPDQAACAGATVVLDGSATVVTGCSGAPQYRWLKGTSVVRDWALDPTAMVVADVSATYRLEARCGDCSASCSGTSTVAVNVLPDPIPADQGNVLRAVKQTADVALDFAGASGLAPSWRLYRDRDKRLLGTNALAPDAPVPAYIDRGAVAPPPDLYFYRLKGLSPCSRTAGP